MTHILLSSPQMASIAQSIHELQPKIILGDVSWKRFPDTYPNTFICDVDALKQADVSFLACFDTPDRIFEEVSMIYTLAELRPRSLKIILPYFPTGTMERVDDEGQIATASTLAQMLSAVAPSGPGPIPLYIWDIHALPIRHYFGQNISPRFKTGTKQLRKRIGQQFYSIAYPDEGSWKRFKRMFRNQDGTPAFPEIICDKVRDGDRRIVTIKQGTVEGRDVIIVDDLIHSGGTIVQCLQALKDAGANSVSAYATHGVFEDGAWKRFLNAGFEHVWTTDSCPSTAQLNEKGPFEVLSIKPSIINAILE